MYQKNDRALNKSNIMLDKIRFQVDGSTILHLYALDFNMLKLVLDFFEDHEEWYLNCILMKNNQGKTPLEITLENDSPKNASLML